MRAGTAGILFTATLMTAACAAGDRDGGSADGVMDADALPQLDPREDVRIGSVDEGS